MKVFFLSLFMLTIGVTASAQVEREIIGKTVRVIDGDTLVMQSPDGQLHTIRLAYVDAPESGQPYGDEARKCLLDIVDDRVLTVKWKKTDRNQRIVGKVFIFDKDVQMELIQKGCAWVFEKYAVAEMPRSEFERYAQAATTAQQAKKGFWQAAMPTPPWEWRARLNVPEDRETSSVGFTRIPTPTPTYSAPRSGHVYIRGPRGGCYYYSGKSKVYVDRSYCN